MTRQIQSSSTQRSFLRTLLAFMGLMLMSCVILILLKKPQDSARVEVAPKAVAGRKMPSHQPSVSWNPRKEETVAQASPAAPGTPELAAVHKLIDEGKREESEALLDKLLTADPENPELLFQKAMILSRESADSSAATELFETVLQKDPSRVEAGDELYELYEKAEDFDLALSKLQDLEQRSSGSGAGVEYALGRLLLESGRPAEARVKLEAALQTANDPTLIREQLASTYMKLGNREEARREWQALADSELTSRSSLNAKAHLAELLIAEGQKPEAEALIQDVVAKDPQHTLANRLAGR